MQYIHVKAASELSKIRHSRPDYDILDTVTGQLLRSLLGHGTEFCAPPVGSLVAALVSKVNEKTSVPTSNTRNEVTEVWSPTNGLRLLTDIGNEDLRSRDNASSTAIVQEALGLTNAIRKLFLKTLIALVSLSLVYVASFWRLAHSRQVTLLDDVEAAPDSLEAGTSNSSVEAERKMRFTPSRMPESPLSAKCLSLLLILLHTDIDKISDNGERNLETGASRVAEDRTDPGGATADRHDRSGLDAILDTFCLLRDESVVHSATPARANGKCRNV